MPTHRTVVQIPVTDVVRRVPQDDDALDESKNPVERVLFGLTAKVRVERTWAGHQLGPGRQKRPAGVAAAQREHTGVEDARHREVAQTRPRGSAERGWKRAQDMRGDDEIRLIQR